MKNGTHTLGASKGRLHGWGTYLGRRIWTSGKKQGWHPKWGEQETQKQEGWNEPPNPMPASSGYQKTRAPSQVKPLIQ